jgi:hypothetical protein
MKEKNYCSFGIAIILGSTLLIGCTPVRTVHSHSVHSEPNRDYYPHQKPQYDEERYEEREHHQHHRHEHDSESSYSNSRNEDRLRQEQLNQQREIEQLRQEQQRIREQESSHKSPSTARTPRNVVEPKPSPVVISPPVKKQEVEQTPTHQTQPEVKTNNAHEPLCSRRTGCEDSKSVNTESSRRER